MDKPHSVAIPCDLSQTYGEDTLILMARDPCWAFAYWEVTEEKRKQVEKETGLKFDEEQVVLRVFEHNRSLNLEAVSFFCDIPVRQFFGQQYLQLNAPGRTFFSEIGFSVHSKQFVSLIRSNRIRLPRAEMLVDANREWSGVHLKDAQRLS